ncbi:TetR/AcrR family transcriptional regulator [Pseudonocardiaceae bacterium YIM PH 21723]|nr:TetR/AcrR family transcriptional regulator [Pseudonocardiaceae bacterium YIM PH 21723]
MAIYGGQSAEERRAQRRERLLDAGLELIGTEGYAATSIEKLCAAAGVATRTFYEEFATKEELLMTLHRQVQGRAAVTVRAALSHAEDASFAERVEVAVRNYVQTMADDPRWARLAFVEVIGVSQAVEANRLGLRHMWTELLSAEARRAAGGDRDFHLGALALIGTVNELVHHWSRNRAHHSVDEVITEILRVANALMLD